jgi:AmmeMemoRadiSam system protein B
VVILLFFLLALTFVNAQVVEYPLGTRGSTAFEVDSAFLPLAEAGKEDIVVLTPYPGDGRMWARILSGEDTYALGDNVRGIVLPHHLADPDEICATWRTLGKEPWDLVVVFSPDHYIVGPENLSLPLAARFSTVYGDVPVAYDLATSLNNGSFGRMQEDLVFPREHGIAIHTTFIRHFISQARFLPILVKSGTPISQLEALARDLVRITPPRTLFVASVDASHYNPVALSQFHDRMTISALENLDGDRLLHTEVDSPESLWLMNRIMELLGNFDARVFLRTDLQDRFSYPIADNTSHLYVRYRQGNLSAQASRTITLLALPWAEPGESLPKGVLDHWNWDWKDPYKTARDYPPLADLVGIDEEDRRLWGSDLYVITSDDGLPLRRIISGVRVSVIHHNGGLDTTGTLFSQERDWAELLVVIFDGEMARDVAYNPDINADLIVWRNPLSQKFEMVPLGKGYLVILPGSLLDASMDGGSVSIGLAASWEDGFWNLEPWPIEFGPIGPRYGVLPAAKSYDPPPIYLDRE